MQQLRPTTAGFEDERMTPRDICPGNLFIDANWDLLLSDLDRVGPIGADLEGVSEPFEPLLNKSEGEDAGTYGKASALTKVFAIGSIYLHSLLWPRAL